MANLLGEVLRMNTLETVHTAVGATVLVRQHGAIVASGIVHTDESFEIELPAGTIGEIEIELGMHNTAPVLTTVEAGKDLRVQIFYNNQAQYA